MLVYNFSHLVRNRFFIIGLFECFNFSDFNFYTWLMTTLEDYNEILNKGFTCELF